MRPLIILCISGLLVGSAFATEPTAIPKVAKTTDDILKVAEASKGYGCVQTAQFSRWGRQVFAVWYDPFSGRAACYLHVYYFDYEKAQWVQFVDQLVTNCHDLSAEMPVREDVVIFRSPEDKVVLKVSVAKFPQKN